MEIENILHNYIAIFYSEKQNLVPISTHANTTFVPSHYIFPKQFFISIHNIFCD